MSTSSLLPVTTHRYWYCSGCDAAYAKGRSEVYECAHADCQEQEHEHCKYCIHSCDNCEKEFCTKHMDADQKYCVGCAAKYPKTVAPAPLPKLPYDQWQLFCDSFSMADTLCRSRIEEFGRIGADASMYEAWLAKVTAARETLIAMGYDWSEAA